MKTIKQIADEIGVSKQAVYKRVKGSLHTVVAPYTHTVDGTVYISEQGEILIIQAFSKTDTYKDTHTEVHNGAYTHTHTNDNEVSFLREQNKTILEQLATKDKQLEDERLHSREQSKRLADLAEQLAELNRNNQILLGSEQTRNSQTSQSFLDDGEEVTSVNDSIKNQGFFSKLFKKNKRIL